VEKPGTRNWGHRTEAVGENKRSRERGPIFRECAIRDFSRNGQKKKGLQRKKVRETTKKVGESMAYRAS